MGFLARLFGGVPKEEWDGMPPGCIAYFEDTGESHVQRYLHSVSVQPPARVAIGTIWPRPDSYHVPLTAEHMEAVADFLEKHPAGFFCAHCHVYRDGVELLQWHDAFSDDPMYISRTIDRDAIARFAEALGCSYSIGFP